MYISLYLRETLAAFPGFDKKLHVGVLSGAVYNARLLKVQVTACVRLYTYILGTVTLTDCQGDSGGRKGVGVWQGLILYLLVVTVSVSYIVY